jgi:hypothetical protein
VLNLSWRYLLQVQLADTNVIRPYRSKQTGNGIYLISMNRPIKRNVKASWYLRWHYIIIITILSSNIVVNGQRHQSETLLMSVFTHGTAG